MSIERFEFAARLGLLRLRMKFGRRPRREPSRPEPEVPAIRAQPRPRAVLVLVLPDRRWTMIARTFREGESQHCRLCPPERCCAVADMCMLGVPGVVANEDAALYDLSGSDYEYNEGGGR